MTMLDEFEAWARRHNESLREDEIDQPEDIRLDRQCGVYIWANAESAWLAWKASRESLVIELPERLDAGSVPEQYYNDGIYDCIETIHAAGVRTK